MRQIRAFIAVAELGSFTRAASELLLSQPALTTTIKLLEAHLGVELFLRTSRHVELTEDGVLFLETVRPRLKELDTCFDLFETRGESAQLSLACTTSIADTLIAEVLSRFLKTDGGISIDLVCVQPCGRTCSQRPGRFRALRGNPRSGATLSQPQIRVTSEIVSGAKPLPPDPAI